MEKEFCYEQGPLTCLTSLRVYSLSNGRLAIQVSDGHNLHQFRLESNSIRRLKEIIDSVLNEV